MNEFVKVKRTQSGVTKFANRTSIRCGLYLNLGHLISTQVSLKLIRSYLMATVVTGILVIGNMADA